MQGSKLGAPPSSASLDASLDRPAETRKHLQIVALHAGRACHREARWLSCAHTHTHTDCTVFA